MSTTKDLGDRGENLTADWLLSRGYQILDRRWRCRYGELDLVAGHRRAPSASWR